MPIGLIDDSWGGSACEAWIRRDLLAADEKYKPLLERWEQIESELSARPRRNIKRSRPSGMLRPRRPRPKASGRYGGRQNPDDLMSGNARPGNIYNGVLKPTIGYGIRGAIWYQGESNAGRAYQYRDLFPLDDPELARRMGRGAISRSTGSSSPTSWPRSPEPTESAWAELREAQTMTMSRLPNTGEAVIIDLGEGKDIHPKNKQDVAKRLARWALARDYGKSRRLPEPDLQGDGKEGNKIVLTFDHVGGGFRTVRRRRAARIRHRRPATTSSSGPRPRSSARTRSKSGPTRSPSRSPSATPGPTTRSAISIATPACR